MVPENEKIDFAARVPLNVTFDAEYGGIRQIFIDTIIHMHRGSC